MTSTNRVSGERRAPRTQFRATQYLVNFGDGPVLARIHTNPDGGAGGLVADTAEVEASAYVGPEARIFGNARVFGNARIDGTAQVYENARIYSSVIDGAASICGNATIEDAHVGEQASVCGDARVGGGAFIGGKAVVRGAAKVLGAVRVDGEAIVEGQAWVSGGHITGHAVSIPHFRGGIIYEEMPCPRREESRIRSSARARSGSSGRPVSRLLRSPGSWGSTQARWATG